jgi:hypothetical protein
MREQDASDFHSKVFLLEHLQGRSARHPCALGRFQANALSLHEIFELPKRRRQLQHPSRYEGEVVRPHHYQ